MKLVKAVGLRLSKLLLDKKMTPYALSIKSGVSKQGISHIMNEASDGVNFSTIIKLADGLGIKLKDFVDDPLFDRENLDLD